jgi:aryl-alcohol dehydrogenase-like predicted oxidoreductase
VRYRPLGATGIQVSPYSLGTMMFGGAGNTDHDECVRIVHQALDAGINVVDTADVYSGGESEEIVGRALQGRRDDVVLASKVHYPMGEEPNRRGNSRRWIMTAVEESLRRLRTDRIDLYQIHAQDILVAEDETLRALDDLVRAGKVLHIGCSNYAAYRLVDSLWTSRTRNLERFVTLQAEYSLVERSLEREHVPACRQWGLGILPWSPLAGGFLSGKYQQDQPPPPGTRLEKWKQRWERHDNARGWKILAELTAVAGELGATPAQTALAWLLHKPVVSSVIFGARSVQQLDDNVAAADLALSAAQLKRLDEASAFELGYPYDFIARISGSW